MQAARLLDVPVSRIREFVEAGFVAPRRGSSGDLRLSFQDLVLLRTAKELSETLSPRKVKEALARLRAQLPRGRELSALRITAQGDAVVARDGAASWEAVSGQTVLTFEVSELAAEVAPLVREAAEQARRGDAPLEPEDWYELGCDLETHDPDEARDAYRRCLELDPRHPDAHVNLGRLLHEEGILEGAREHYRLALEARPHDATAAYNLGVCLQDLGRAREAIRAYHRALEWDPENADAHFNLAQLYEDTGRHRRARRHMESYREMTRDPAP
jgi:tetratricopeptide (TPR) repeat protein